MPQQTSTTNCMITHIKQTTEKHIEKDSLRQRSNRLKHIKFDFLNEIPYHFQLWILAKNGFHIISDVEDMQDRIILIGWENKIVS